jgi:hypothetical protein
MASALDDAIAAITAKVTTTVAVESAAAAVEVAATTFVNSVPGLIADAVAHAQGQGATMAQIQAITDLGANLETASGPLLTANKALGDALTANQPAG